MKSSVFLYSCDRRIRDLCRQCGLFCSFYYYSDFDVFCAEIMTVPPALILIDYALAATVGPESIARFCSCAGAVPVFFLSFEDCSQFTRWFSRLGVQEVITLPCRPAYLAAKLNPLLERLQQSVGEWSKTLGFNESEFSDIIGTTPEMYRLKYLLARFARTDTPLLLSGESGTGKTYIAERIHNVSLRSGNSFHAVNMASIPAQLAEAELFGTAAGAFTDAVSRNGYFAYAERGTLLLDEIGELPVPVQPKLLHVLENNTYYRVGSPVKQQCNVRFLFATNADLQKQIKCRRFREDLYYRIAVIPVLIPPLRERKPDIPVLAEHFLVPYRKTLSAAGLRKLCDYNWPGNIRELKNCLTRACLISPSAVVQDQHVVFNSAF
ncbi:sigma 54-interacting transcriptional regulator [Treponema brennaborense]|uniref:Sigma 54 interacting domain protein n=1 Tax=Treponema brennaborense (strain DSM 12168 / CIP 105900 / DD5/3) TaxID=906968 RepID=F4LL86_TREBD|nr:sigma-54 dependent transcriptional regulator [Treponema brennaborense]AEE17660.1 Sigma 54 interacting domain protein [Treponema brennaborense DSM 12168]